MTRKRHSVAVVGAGIAGVTVAHALALAGHPVHVFDKARGPGGRLATRRVEWVDRQGHAAATRLDHGALGFTASSPAFQAFVDLALRAGCLAEWKPRLAPGSLPLGGAATLYVPAPDMPALCRHLLDGAPMSLSFAVDGLQRGPLGWQVHADGVRHASTFDAVVLALPPVQAAPLLNPHRLDWARHASTALMQPCWTLMGIADDPGPDSGWDLARPPSGPLAWALRNDARPGRATVPGQAQWVAHARTGWWDAAQGLGVCGDFLGGCGVEGAWLSAQTLCTAMLRRTPDAGDASAATAHESAVDPTHPAARRRAA